MVLPGLLVPLTVLTLQAQAGGRVRTDTVSSRVSGDLLAIPTVTLAMSERDWTMSLGSTSSAAYLDIFNPQPDPFSFTESVIASFNYRKRQVTVTVTENGQIGYQNLRLGSLTLGASPLTPGASPGGPLPANGGSNTLNGVLRDDMVLYGSSSTNVMVGEMISRDVTLSQYARLTLTTGFGSDVEKYPGQLSFGGGIQGQYRFNERETVGLQAYSDRTATRGLAPLISVGIGATWNHQFSARVSGFVNVGTSYIFPDSDDPELTETRPPSFYPNMSLGMNIDRTPFTVTMGMIPVIDQISGQVDTRVTGALQYSERKGLYVWTASLGTATSVEQDRFGAFVSVFGNASVGYFISQDLQLTAGGGSNYQLAPYADDDGSAIFFAQFGISFTPRGIRL